MQFEMEEFTKDHVDAYIKFAFTNILEADYNKALETLICVLEIDPFNTIAPYVIGKKEC